MTAQRGPASGEGDRRRVGARRPRALVVLIGSAVAGSVAFLVGFAAFLWSIDRHDREPAMSADAIVALTGGQGRIEDALDLLAKGYGRRLLITGVNERTSREAIKRLSPNLRELVECCVDLDYRARNTIGNAAEIRGWVRKNAFSSLIVVTSNYHLPRTLAELDEVLPGIRKVPHAVVGGRGDEDWETRLARGRVMLVEYTKFLAVAVRTRVSGWASESWISAAARRGSTSAIDRPQAG